MTQSLSFRELQSVFPFRASGQEVSPIEKLTAYRADSPLCPRRCLQLAVSRLPSTREVKPWATSAATYGRGMEAGKGPSHGRGVKGHNRPLTSERK